MTPKPGDDPLVDKLRNEIEFVNKLLAKSEKENSDLKIKQQSLEQVIEQLESNKLKMDKELYNANALANRAVEAQERADLERKVADQSSDEYRAALIKSKEAHDLAMQTIHDLKTTDAHKELNTMRKKLSDERDKQFDLSV